MKVVLVTSIERGGPIEQSLVQARGLLDEGMSVTVICATTQVADRFEEHGVHTEVIPLRHQADAVNAMRIWKLVRGADVVHAHDRRAGLWTRLGPRPKSNGVRVYTVHGLPEPYHPPPTGQEHPGLRARLLYRGLDAALCARAEAIVVPSHTVARELVARLRYPAEKITVIPNGIEPPDFAPGNGELIGTLSLLEPVKGLDVFLHAAALLADTHPEWRFVMFGTGSDAPRLDSLASELGLDRRVERPGFVAAQQALRRLRVYVLSSYAENAPIALLEAMAAGVPVVASAVGGVPEIADERVARMVPAGDPGTLANAIEQAYLDTPETSERVRAARVRVEERFTAVRNARATVELYSRLQAEHAR
jgi:glycosyltransferase involved in cell wall biosynthesis